jgi:hypothetical protein
MATMQGEASLEGAPALVVPGRRNDAGMGWTWIVEAWRLFKRAPLMWIISIVIVFVAAIAVGIIPLLGFIAMPLLQTVFLGGYMSACLALDRGEAFELEHLFSGFSKRFVPLLIVGALYMLGSMAILLVIMAFAGAGMLSAFMAGDPELAGAAIIAASGAMALGGLVALALLVPLMAAYWFAPALVMIHGMGPVAAMKESFFSCFRNFVPFVVYGIIMFVLSILAVIPLGLGMLILVPMFIASVYTSYRTIFTGAAR